MRNNIGLCLSKRAFLNPERLAYIDGFSEERLSFDDLNRRCNQLANALIEDGIGVGDRVGLLLMNSSEFMESYFALAKVGAVVVPLNWRLVADELEFILKDSGTTRLIFDAAFAETVADLHSRGDKTDIAQWLQLADPGAEGHFAVNYRQFRDAAPDTEPDIRASDDDMLYIMYTSGTTGLPKGVVHTHTTAFWALFTLMATADQRDADVYLAPLPMFHVGALTPITACVYRGISSVVMREFNPVRAWELIEREKVTTGLAVPAMLNFMLQVPNLAQYDYSSLRWCMSGAAPVPEALINQYADMGIEIHQIYGLTETCGPACLVDPGSALTKVGSTGKAFFHTEIRIVDEHGNECPAGTAGEVTVKGGHIMREYWNRPDATAETLKDGWLYTGDVAVMDEDGDVFIQDRIKDMIISGGENVYPAELENILQSHPDIVEAAVIGRASEKWGESPFAIVVSSNEALREADVLEYCRGKMAAYKLPKGAVFIDTIPRNPSGKILKRVLRERYPEPAPV